MRSTAYSKLLLLASASLLVFGCGEGAGRDSERDSHAVASTALQYQNEVDEWHAGRIERLQREDGWLTLVGLHLLQEGENRIGTGPDREIQLPGSHPESIGSLFVERGSFRFESADGVAVNADGEPVSSVGVRSDEGGTGEATVLQAGSLRFYVIQRGENHYLRSKDSQSAVRREFQGIDRYPVDPDWRIEAKLVPYEQPQSLAIGNSLGATEMRSVIGELVFTHEGGDYRLLPIGKPGESLFLVFGDTGNGVTSYGGGRFLYTDPPAKDGTVIVDFNRSYNPPCAFTPYATCPLPPEENLLPFEVRAGEKSWEGEHH